MPQPVLILTRPRAQSEAVLAQLPDESRAGLRVVISPLIETRATGPLPRLETARGLILSSAAGARAFGQLGGLYTGPVYTVGAATAEAARAVGLRVARIAVTADALVKDLVATPPDAPLIHLHGTVTRGDIAARLTAAGLPTTAAPIYDQPALPLSPEAQDALRGTAPVIAPLFSPRTASLFAGGAARGAPLYLVCMSDAVAQPLHPLTAQEIRIAPEPTALSMAATMRSLVDDVRLGKC